jgi:hypothetical protein
MQPQELYFRGSMAQYWNVIYAEYQRLHAALGHEPFEFTGRNLKTDPIAGYVPKETDSILIAFWDDEHRFEVISVDAEFSRAKEMVWIMAHDQGVDEEHAKSAFSRWQEVKNALEESGRLVDPHAHILDNKPHLLAKPEKPPKPERRSNINAWFDWYHRMRAAGFRCALSEIAKETHLSLGHIKHRHANYNKERGLE